MYLFTSEMSHFGEVSFDSTPSYKIYYHEESRGSWTKQLNVQYRQKPQIPTSLKL